MKYIQPYSNLESALAALDNGGRFYNFFSKAGDGQVDAAELSKVAGVIGDRQRMFLYFDLAISQLPIEARAQIKNAMSDELVQLYGHYAPRYLSPGVAKETGVSGESAVITGTPKLIDDQSKLSGFIMVPIMAGKVMTFSMIPIFERFKVYKVYDLEQERSCIVAHAKNDQALDAKAYTFGGVLKQLQKDQQQSAQPEVFLEAFYYSECKKS